jgi:selenocysteine-specific elongation factor
MKPGTAAWVRIVLRDPALLLPGDRFIIRMFSPVITIGGGVVVDIGDHRYRTADRPSERLSILASDDVAARIALLIREQSFGMSLDALVERTGLSAREIAAAGAHAIGDWYIDRAWMNSARDKMVKTVTEFHRKNPLQPGIPRQDLREGAPQHVLDTLLAESKELVAEGEIVRARSHKVVLKDDEQQARAKIEAAFEKAGLAVPALVEVLAQSGVEPARARSILQILLRERRLHRIGDDLVFHHTAIAQLKESLAPRKGQRFAVPDFKTWTGISRKYAIPLLEFLDRERVTRRDGDQRIVL